LSAGKPPKEATMIKKDIKETRMDKVGERKLNMIKVTSSKTCLAEHDPHLNKKWRSTTATTS